MERIVLNQRPESILLKQTFPKNTKYFFISRNVQTSNNNKNIERKQVFSINFH